MIPDIPMFCDLTALVLQWQQSLWHEDNKKIRQYGFYFIESAKANLVLKCLELKFCFAFVLQNSFALVFKEMDHCCVCCIMVAI
jgi:hypothetical protein